MSLKNATTLPKVYYGLHMCEGVAEYREKDKEPYRIFIGETCLKNMDPTFEGRPIYVEHVDDVNLENLQNEADGYVAESFFNPRDGKHWTKFIVVSDAGHRAIANGWKLSNAYVPKRTANGGEWHGVQYAKEITEGEYEHLAIVRNPRYAESVILTPEEFKVYNSEKEIELKKLANSKEGDQKMKLNFFKRAKVENGADLEGMSVVLPKSGKEVTIAQLVNEADEKAEKMGGEHAGLADLSHKVKLHDGSYCNVGELLEKHKALHDEMEKAKAVKDGAEAESESDVKTEAESVEVEGDKHNEEKDEADKKLEEEKKKNEADAKAKAKADADAKKKETFEKIKNANAAEDKKAQVIELSSDRVARGKNRYGTGN